MEEVLIIRMSKDEFESMLKKTLDERLQKINPPKKEKDDKIDKFYKVNDICDIFGVSRTTVYQWMKTGKISYKTLGNKKFFTKEDIDNALQRIDFSNFSELSSTLIGRKNGSGGKNS